MPRRVRTQPEGAEVVEHLECSVDQCARSVYRRRLCCAHYQSQRRAGLLPPRTREQLFWEKVDKTPTGCWLWTGALIAGPKGGYGSFHVGDRRTVAHRYSYELLVGPVPTGLDLDHLCRVRACVNPAHLEPVTRRENTHRGSAGRPARPACPHGHPFDPANTLWEKNGAGRTCRVCRTCRTEQRRRRSIEVRGAKAAA